MRATAVLLLLTGFAALAQLVPACSHASGSPGGSPGNDASTDVRSGGEDSGGGLGNDGPAPDAIDLGDGSSSGGGGENCALPSGTYAVTATPDSDGDPECMPWTSSVTFPPSTKPDDAGRSCTYVPMGSLPVCAVAFNCQGVDDAGNLDTITGFIEVDGTSIAGNEEIAPPPGDENAITCSYHLSYVKQ